ncbi:unnamed protein product, partial [Rotaria sp. Silwood1]
MNLSTNFDNKLKDLTINIDAKFNHLSNELNLLFELVQPTIGRAIDPWDITARSHTKIKCVACVALCDTT